MNSKLLKELEEVDNRLNQDCYIEIKRTGTNTETSLDGDALGIIAMLNQTIKLIQKKIGMSDKNLKYFLENIEIIDIDKEEKDV